MNVYFTVRRWADHEWSFDLEGGLAAALALEGGPSVFHCPKVSTVGVGPARIAELAVGKKHEAIATLIAGDLHAEIERAVVTSIEAHRGQHLEPGEAARILTDRVVAILGGLG